MPIMRLMRYAAGRYDGISLIDMLAKSKMYCPVFAGLVDTYYYFQKARFTLLDKLDVRSVVAWALVEYIANKTQT